MVKRKSTTKQEREQYIQNFLASGKTRLSWCNENNIKLSTLGRWLQDYRAKQQEVKFIPFASEQCVSQQPCANEILIEIGICKLYVPEKLGIHFMKQAIKAVTESNVSIS